MFCNKAIGKISFAQNFKRVKNFNTCISVCSKLTEKFTRNDKKMSDLNYTTLGFIENTLVAQKFIFSFFKT